MKKFIQLFLILLIVITSNTKSICQHLGSFDLLTDPIDWSNESANIGGQLFINQNLALYGAITKQDGLIETIPFSGNYAYQKIDGAIRYFPFGVRKLTLFHPAYGPSSRYMKRKNKRESGCEAMEGFPTNHPFSILQGLFIGVGFQQKLEDYHSTDLEQLNEEKVIVKSNKIAGSIGYHLRIEHISISFNYTAAYGKVNPTGSEEIIAQLFEAPQPLGFNDFDDHWQIQVGFNF